ncbi:lantibiotic dehydratase [Streptomyces sp. NPDC007856]|uniref:lantibiotic dehydratase n=1 Tax=Streptomyces sp. NPDC007856 TaxID=3364781 RepID=UPI0036B02106
MKAREPIRRLPLAGDWSMWDLSGLRSAGTPADRVLVGPGRDGEELLHQAISDPWFVAAVAWQHPDLVRDWLGARHQAALRGEPRRPLKPSHQRIIGSYLQRYASKNDVIGFSGPTGSAQWDDQADRDLTVEPGASVTGEPRVCFEPWALEKLVEHWAADERLRWHMPVERDPSSVLRGTRLFRSNYPVELDRMEIAIHQSADGVKTAGELFEETVTSGLAPRTASARAGFVKSLSDLASRKIVDWRFTVPLHNQPEVSLREQVARIADPAVRAELLAPLDALESARAEVAAVAKEPLPLLDALSHMDAVFTAHTGAPPLRRATGRRTGHGRRVLYMDSTRDVRVVIGPRLREALAEPLGLVLDSARWLTAEVAELVRSALHGHLDRADSDRSPLFAAYPDIVAVLSPETGGPLDQLVGRLRTTWAELLGASPELRSVRPDLGLLTERVRAAFAADGYGWAAARQHTPDVMLAVDRWQDGQPVDFHWVLGELHTAISTLENRVFTTGYSDPDRLAAAVAEDFAGGRVLAAFPRRSPLMNQRVYPPLSWDVPGRYRYWSWSDKDTLAPEQPRTPGADLWLLRDGTGALRAVSSDGAFDADAVEVLGEFLSEAVAERFGMLPTEWAHLPRVTLGRLVVQRETWRIRARELDGTSAPLAELGVPRHSFVLVPGEAKPFLCDQANPVLQRQLTRSVGRALAQDEDAVVTVSEMLPGFDQLWLSDRQGRRYTSELRVLAVDTMPHRVVVE